MSTLSNILYVMGSDQGDIRDLKQALVLAEESQATVTVLDTIEALPRSARMLVTSVPTDEIRKTVLAQRLDMLEGLLATLRPDAVDIRIRVRFGKRAREIVSEAAEHAYDVLIKYPDKGGTDRQLYKRCNCPLQLLNHEDYMTPGRNLMSRISNSIGFEKKRRGRQVLRPGARSFAS